MSLIMEALQRAQQLRIDGPGDTADSEFHPPASRRRIPPGKKRWFLGFAGLIGLAILILFLGGFLTPSHTGGSRDPVSPPQEPDRTLPRPQLPRQVSLHRSPAPQGPVEPHVPKASCIPPAPEVMDARREPLQTAKAPSKPVQEEGRVAVLSQPVVREPASAPEPAEPRRPAQPETRAEPSPPAFPVPPREVSHGDERASLSEDSGQPLPAAPAAGEALQESPVPAGRQDRSAPIEVRQERREESAAPPEAVRQFNRAVALHQRRERMPAIQAYRKAIALNPASVEAYNNLGLLFQEAGEWDQARAAYQKAVDIDPGYVKAYNNLGVLALLRGHEAEAMALFQKTLALFPDHYESHLHLGVLYRKRGQIHEAIESYQKALSIQPSQAEAYYNLGLLYEKTADTETAVRYYRKFIRMASATYPDLVSKIRRHTDRLLKKQAGESIGKETQD